MNNTSKPLAFKFEKVALTDLEIPKNRPEDSLLKVKMTQTDENIRMDYLLLKKLDVNINPEWGEIGPVNRE